MAVPQAPRPPARRRRGWVGPVVFLVVLGVAAAAAVAVVGATDDDDATASSARTKGSTTAVEATTTTTVSPTFRLTGSGELSEYCNAPGVKWSEVPPHVPGEPSRTQVRFMGGGANTASDSRSEPSDTGFSSSLSTVISPRTDGAFTSDESVLARTRTVTCVTFLSTEPVGDPCPYNDTNQWGMQTGGTVSLQPAVNKFQVTVYELHSGGVLHKGEIHTRMSGCPAWAYTQQGPYVAYGLTEQDVLSWLNSHFVGGKPA